MKTLFFLPLILSLASTMCSAKGADSAKNNDNGVPYVIYRARPMRNSRLNDMAKKGMDSANCLITSYNKGGDDAYNSYDGKHSGKRLIEITTLAGTPVAGLVTGIVCSLKKIKDKDLNLPDDSLATNSAYMKGYRGEAACLKKRLLIKNFVAASVIWAGFANILLL